MLRECNPLNISCELKEKEKAFMCSGVFPPSVRAADDDVFLLSSWWRRSLRLHGAASAPAVTGLILAVYSSWLHMSLSCAFHRHHAPRRSCGYTPPPSLPRSDRLCSSYCVRVNKTLTWFSPLFGKLFNRLVSYRYVWFSVHGAISKGVVTPELVIMTGAHTGQRN